MSTEANFDGLIGPNHNYAGLAEGNLASARNAQLTAHPKQAALQGLEKMRTLIRMGYTQGFLLPQQRPRIDVLRKLGFTGSDEQVVIKTAKQAPELLPLVYSASSMWAANAATVTPAADSGDGRTHFTVANLVTTAHRSFEHHETERALRTVFADSERFSVHAALPSHPHFADEGAANHTRLCANYTKAGAGVFVFGREGEQTTRYPARQTLSASRAVARQHGLGERAIFLKQSPVAIDGGAFHNDVVAVGNGPVLFYHEDAFEDESREAAFAAIEHLLDLKTVCVPRAEVSLSDAIQSYLFNSQLLADPDGSMNTMRLICPTECRDTPAVARYLENLCGDTRQPIREVIFVDVRQSMSNGGGPACLRLRVVLDDAARSAVNPQFLLDGAGVDRLTAWVEGHYRDTIAPRDLADPHLLRDCYQALDALTQILDLGSYYDFQR